MRALIESKPRVFSLKEILHEFIAKRLDSIRRKAQFILEKNKKKLNNLKTRIFIIINYKEIAKIIKKYHSEEKKKKHLTENFKKISEEKIKISSFLDMP